MHERERDLIFLSFFPFLFHSFSLSFFYSDTQAFTHTFSLSLLTIYLSLIHSLLSLCHTHTLSFTLSFTYTCFHSLFFTLSASYFSLSLSLSHFLSLFFIYIPRLLLTIFFLSLSLSLSSHSLSHAYFYSSHISLTNTLHQSLTTSHCLINTLFSFAQFFFLSETLHLPVCLSLHLIFALSM